MNIEHHTEVHPDAPSTDSAPVGASRSGVPRSLTLLAIASLAVVAGLVAVYAGLMRKPDPASAQPLPVVHPVPEFSLTERSGRDVTRDDLLGRVWIADFIFTSCTGPCPALTRRMVELQAALKKHGDAVRLVTFSVDPTFDTPKVLRRYADRFHADADRWWFLTCDDEAAMHKLVREGFLSIVEPGGDAGALLHTTSLMLVDAQGRIRGRYHGDDPKEKPRLLADVKRLLAERDAP